MTDEEIVKRVIKRDEEAFGELLSRYGGLVKSIVRSSLQTLPEWFDDCVNEVFFALWHNMKSYDNSKNSLKNWIAAVAKYKAIDYKRKFRASMSVEELPEDVVDPKNDILLADLRCEAEELLSALPEDDRELFIRCYIMDESIDEISRRTKRDPSWIYNRLSRGRRKLRKIYQNWGDEI